MRLRLPPNVHRELNRHKTPVFYYRVGKGPRIRLPVFGTSEFDAAYTAAQRGEAPPRPIAAGRAREGTLRWLVEQYKQSLHFRGLGPVTQRRRDSFFRQMVATSGDRQIVRITEQAIIDGRERRTQGKGHAANNFLKAVKPMFAYAKARKWIDVDPAKHVEFAQPIKGTRKTWTIKDVERFEQRHPLGTMAHLAMRLLLLTGLRRSDVVLLGPQHLRDGVFSLTPGKTRDSSAVVVTFRALPPLLEAIDATRWQHPQQAGTVEGLAYLRTEWGGAFASGASFGNWFRERCIEAKVDARAHGLRKLGAVLAAEAGASANELMAMFGWTTLAQAKLYTDAADRRRMGKAASERLLDGLAEAQSANAKSRTLDGGAGTERKA